MFYIAARTVQNIQNNKSHDLITLYTAADCTSASGAVRSEQTSLRYNVLCYITTLYNCSRKPGLGARRDAMNENKKKSMIF